MSIIIPSKCWMTFNKQTTSINLILIKKWIKVNHLETNRYWRARILETWLPILKLARRIQMKKRPKWRRKSLLSRKTLAMGFMKRLWSTKCNKTYKLCRTKNKENRVYSSKIPSFTCINVSLKAQECRQAGVVWVRPTNAIAIRTCWEMTRTKTTPP